MKTNINLLSEKAQLKFAQIGQIKKTRTILISAAVVFFLFSAFVFVGNIRLKKESAVLRQRLNIAQTRIEAQKETELQTFLLKSRIKKISEVLEARKNISQLLWGVVSLLPPQAKIEQAKASTQEVQIVFRLPTYFEATDFIDNFPREDVEKLGGEITSFPSLKREPEGEYLVDLKIKF